MRRTLLLVGFMNTSDLSDCKEIDCKFPTQDEDQEKLLCENKYHSDSRYEIKVLFSQLKYMTLYNFTHVQMSQY